LERYEACVGKTYKVLVEGTSKKSDDFMNGRNTQNAMCIFPKGNLKKGEYVNVKIDRCNSATLFGTVVD
jgi:tRNA-2-methylthio-N6-dimethylallyladenosine synthase